MERKLISSATVRNLCGGISDMSLWRWLNNPALNFPKPVYIAKRRYWREAEVMTWLDGLATIRPDAVKKGEQPIRRRRTKQILIRGTTYTSAADAAEHLGVSVLTVRSAAYRGTLDFVGLGTGSHFVPPAPQNRPEYGSAAKPITVQGVKYPSRKIAAEVLGISQTALSGRISRGTTQNIGNN